MKTLLLALVTASLYSQSTERGKSYMRDGKVLIASSIASPSPSSLRRLGEELKRNRSITLAAERFYVSPQANRLASPPPTYDNCNYDLWTNILHSLPGWQRCPVTSEVVKIGANVALRTVTSTCQVASRPIKGSGDPLTVGVEGDHMDIVWLHSYGRSKYSHNPSITTIFARTSGDVSEAKARALLEKMIAITGVVDLDVVLRSDNNFFSTCGFPVRNPFDAQFGLPSKQEFSESKHWTCTTFGSRSHSITCDRSF